MWYMSNNLIRISRRLILCINMENISFDFDGENNLGDDFIISLNWNNVVLTLKFTMFKTNGIIFTLSSKVLQLETKQKIIEISIASAKMLAKVTPMESLLAIETVKKNSWRRIIQCIIRISEEIVSRKLINLHN